MVQTLVCTPTNGNGGDSKRSKVFHVPLSEFESVGPRPAHNTTSSATSLTVKPTPTLHYRASESRPKSPFEWGRSGKNPVE